MHNHYICGHSREHQLELQHSSCFCSTNICLYVKNCNGSQGNIVHCGSRKRWVECFGHGKKKFVKEKSSLWWIPNKYYFVALIMGLQTHFAAIIREFKYKNENKNIRSFVFYWPFQRLNINHFYYAVTIIMKLKLISLKSKDDDLSNYRTKCRFFWNRTYHE